MTDVFTPEQRRKNMQHIRSQNTKIEVILRKALWKKGYRYRKNYKKLPGKPDIALTKYKIAIFCDGEFFHGKDWEILKPRLEKGKNSDFWVAKISRNRERDDEINKKLLFMGQEFGQEKEWNEKQSLSWELLEDKEHLQLKNYMAALHAFYKANPALYQLDEKPEGFEWINGMEWEKNLLIFLRRTRKKEDTLLVVCNFSNVEYDDFRIGVPYPGKYKEMFNSDAESYGGTGVGNPRVKMSKKTECDERKNSITVKLAPLSVQVFSYTKPETGAASNKSAKAKTAAKAAAEKKTGKKGKPAGKTEEAVKAVKAKKTTKHTLYSTQELTGNNQRPINKAQKVMTIHIINNVRVPYI